MKPKKKRYTDEQIHNMIDEGMNTMKIRALHVSPKRIARISRNESGNPPGAPKKFNNEHFNFIVETILADPRLRATQLQDNFKKRFNLTISTGKISQILHEHKIFYGHAIKIQNIKDYQIIERYNFSLEKVNSNQLFFERIIFTDECKFQNNPDSLMIYRQKGNYSENFFADFEKFPISCIAWGAIGIDFKPDLYFFDKTVNSESYIEMFIKINFFENAQNRFKNSNFFFQQDGARCHFKPEVLKFIFERSNLVCGWPSNSPDLSPVEMMWSIVKFRISNYPIDLKPINREQLINAIQKEWRAIDMETVNRLVNSF